jgi:protein MpaA
MGRHGKTSAAAIAAATIAGVAALATATADDRPVSKPAAAPPMGLARLVGGGPRFVSRVRVGRSTRGRPILVTATGNPSAKRHVLVVGCIHGTECAGMAVARLVAGGPPGGCPPTGADLWAVRNLDPDGRAMGSRLNGRGVDLNRNFPTAWKPIGVRWDLEYSGPHPFSESETRAARAIIRAFRPDVTIWFHQQAEALVRAWGPSVPAARRYARLVGLPFRHMHWLAGTAPHWQNTAFPGTTSFVVELPPGALTAAAARRHAHAVFELAGVAPRRVRG